MVSDIFTLTVENVDDAPVIQNAIADIMVEEDAENTEIDLSDTFTDIDNDNSAISKTILANGNKDLVTATLDGDNLILDYQNNQSGSTEITIQGQSNSQAVEDTFTVTVNPVNDPPVVNTPLANITTAEDAEFSFAISDNTFNDVDAGDTLTYTATLEDDSDLPEWLTFDTETKTFSGTPVNSNVGSLEVKVTATDNSGEAISDRFILTVENVDDAPVVLNEIVDVTVEEDAKNTVIDLSETFSDIDNNDNAIAKTVLANGNEDLVTVTLDGDNLILDYQNERSGTTEITIQGQSNSQTVEGTFSVTVNPVDDLPIVSNEITDLTLNENAENQTIDLSNVFSDVDGDEITLNVKNNSNDSLVLPTLDGNNLTLDFQEEQFGTADITIEATANGKTIADTFTVTVNEVISPPPSNTPPRLANAIADTVATEDSQFILTIPENTFADADPGDSLTYTATLEDGSDFPDWLAFDADSRTLNGTPANRDVGNLEVKVTATDNANEMVSDIFTLTVENVDDAPVVLNEIANVAVEEDTANTVINLSETFTDIDNDNNLIIKTVSANNNASLVIANLENNNLTLDYQDNQWGTAEITIQGESNGQIVEDTFSVTVNSVDDLPIVSNEIADVIVDENANNQTIDLSNVFSDVDGDEITLAVKSNSNETLISTALDGNNLTLDFQEEQFGNADITIEATANGETVENTFNVSVNEMTLTPSNNPPKLVNEIADTVATEGSQFSFTVPQNTFVDSDEENTLTYSATLENGNELPDWLTFDAATKTFSGTPSDGDVANLEVKVTATDSDNEIVSDTFAITVNEIDNPPTVINPVADISVDAGAQSQTIDLSNVFKDTDGDELRTIVKRITNSQLVDVELDGSNLTLDFAEERFGTAEITLQAKANGQTAKQTFSVEVNEAVATDNPPTVINPVADISVDAGAQSQTIDLSNVFKDTDGDELRTIVKRITNSQLVDVELDGDNLTLDFAEERFGTAEITLQAKANGQTAKQTFSVEVNEAEEPLSVEVNEAELVTYNFAKSNIHRFYQSEKGFYLYTSDLDEINTIREQSDAGELPFDYEERQFSVLSDNKDTLTGEVIEDVEPIYSFLNDNTGAYLYTIDEHEKSFIQDNLSNYTFKGIEYYAFESQPENIETVPVYRLYNGVSGSHLLTVDQNEVNYIQDNLDYFSTEGNDGVVFHAFEV